MSIICALLLPLFAITVKAVATSNSGLTLSCPDVPNQEPGIANSCRNQDLSATPNDLTQVDTNIGYIQPNYDTPFIYGVDCYYGPDQAVSCEYNNGVSSNGNPEECPAPLAVSTAGAMGRRSGYAVRDTTLPRANRVCPQISPDGQVYLTQVQGYKEFEISTYFDGLQPVRYLCIYHDLRTPDVDTEVLCYYGVNGNLLSSQEQPRDVTNGFLGAKAITRSCPVELCDFSAQFAKRERLSSRQFKGSRFVEGAGDSISAMARTAILSIATPH